MSRATPRNKRERVALVMKQIEALADLVSEVDAVTMMYCNPSQARAFFVATKELETWFDRASSYVKMLA
jgi:hypothetical protein